MRLIKTLKPGIIRSGFKRRKNVQRCGVRYLFYFEKFVLYALLHHHNKRCACETLLHVCALRNCFAVPGRATSTIFSEHFFILFRSKTIENGNLVLREHFSIILQSIYGAQHQKTSVSRPTRYPLHHEGTCASLSNDPSSIVAEDMEKRVHLFTLGKIQTSSPRTSLTL